MAKINIDRSDLLWSYAGNFFKLATNIVLLPIILRYLTDIELGLWYVFASISHMVVLLDFGFAPALSRNISYVWCGATKLQKEDTIEIESSSIDSTYFKIVLTTCQYIYYFISFAAVLFMLTGGLYYINSLDNSTPTIIAWIIYTAGVFLNTLYGYYTSFLRGVGAVAENNKAGVLAKAIQIILSAILLSNGGGLIGISVAYLLSGFVLRVISKYYFNNYCGIKDLLKTTIIENKMRKCWDLFVIIWHNASRDGLVTVSNYLSTQANTLICSSVLGLTSTGSYGLFVQIATVSSTLSGIPFTSYHPAMQEKAIRKDYQESCRLFSTSMTLYAGLFVIMTLCVYIGMPIIKMLKNNLEVDNLMFLSIMAQMFIYQMYVHAASYISTFNIIPYAKSFIISSLVSVLISYLLAKYTDLGLWTLIITPLVISLIYNAWKWPLEAVRISRTSFSIMVIYGWQGCKKYIKSIIKK